MKKDEKPIIMYKRKKVKFKHLSLWLNVILTILLVFATILNINKLKEIIDMANELKLKELLIFICIFVLAYIFSVLAYIFKMYNILKNSHGWLNEKNQNK